MERTTSRPMPMQVGRRNVDQLLSSGCDEIEDEDVDDGNAAGEWGGKMMYHPGRVQGCTRALFVRKRAMYVEPKVQSW